jgi:hypothetical protein
LDCKSKRFFRKRKFVQSQVLWTANQDASLGRGNVCRQWGSLGNPDFCRGLKNKEPTTCNFNEI